MCVTLTDIKNGRTMGNVPCTINLCNGDEVKKSGYIPACNNIMRKQVMTDDDLVVAKGKPKTRLNGIPAVHYARVHTIGEPGPIESDILSISERGMERRLFKDLVTGDSESQRMHVHRAEVDIAEIDHDITPRKDIDFSSLANSVQISWSTAHPQNSTKNTNYRKP